MEFLHKSRYGLGRTDLFPDVLDDALYDVPATHVDKFLLSNSGYSFYISLSVNLTSHFSNFGYFRRLQIPNAQTKYYEIVPAHTKTPRNTTRKIANRYFEIKYHFLTLRKKFRLPLNKDVLITFISYYYVCTQIKKNIYLSTHWIQRWFS